MKRALFYLIVVAVAAGASRVVQIGGKSLWQRGSEVYHSQLYQRGIKGIGDRIIERVRPRGSDKRGHPRNEGSCTRPQLRLLLSEERGPDSERDLPPAPIPPPKEPLLDDPLRPSFWRTA